MSRSRFAPHGLDSPLHRWEPRCKVVGLMALIFAFAAVEKLWLFLPTIAVTLFLYRLSGLPAAFLGQRARYPGFFLLALAIFLPFASGETVVARVGFLALHREGLLAALGAIARFFCIFTVGLLLFSTTSISSLSLAFRSLGLPEIIADMMLLFYRYLYEMGDRLRAMQMAMGLRGFRPRRPSWRNLKTLAALAGSLLVRSYDRAERVYQAMNLRGYGQPGLLRSRRPATRRDWLALGASLGVALLFAIAQAWP